MPLSRKLALDEAQLADLMNSCWNLRIATIGPGNRINLTPMWFGWAGGRIYIYGRGQKVVNLRRNPNCTIVVDRNERFPELQAAMFTGSAIILEDRAAEDADPFLPEVRVQMGIKYQGGHGEPGGGEPKPNAASATGDNGRWMVFTPDDTLTWDNFKIAALRSNKQK
jgi:hypothetical protein